jgi:hypothetical protein
LQLVFDPTFAVDQAKAKNKPARKSRPSDDDHDDQPPTALTVPEDTPQEPAPVHQGKLILDVTVAPQAIRYPTDLNLLNEARVFSEQIIDTLYAHTDRQKKPRTYRQKARKAYLAIVKRRRPGAKLRRRGIKQQLQYVRRNLGPIERLLEYWPQRTQLPLPGWLFNRYWVIQPVHPSRVPFPCSIRSCQ